MNEKLKTKTEPLTGEPLKGQTKAVAKKLPPKVASGIEALNISNDVSASDGDDNTTTIPASTRIVDKNIRNPIVLADGAENLSPVETETKDLTPTQARNLRKG